MDWYLIILVYYKMYGPPKSLKNYYKILLELLLLLPTGVIKTKVECKSTIFFFKHLKFEFYDTRELRKC